MSTNTINGSFLESNLDSLGRNVKAYRSSEKFLAVMKTCSRFHYLVPYNVMLVEMQRPGARYVLSEKEWRNRYDRGIKPNKTRKDVSDDVLSFAAGADYAARIELLVNHSHNNHLQIGKDRDMAWQAYYLLSINKNAQNGECFASIYHELGHFFCQHLVAPYDWKEWQVRGLPHAAKEFEAEYVSWVVCE